MMYGHVLTHQVVHSLAELSSPGDAWLGSIDVSAVKRALARPSTYSRHGCGIVAGRTVLSMGVVKGDDHEITWDSVAMQQGW